MVFGTSPYIPLQTLTASDKNRNSSRPHTALSRNPMLIYKSKKAKPILSKIF